jgi:very-short-patch-repair endonuclease
MQMPWINFYKVTSNIGIFKVARSSSADVMVNIEVDGGQQNFHPGQALFDLKRTFFACKKGYLTLRIPNAPVKHHMEETADFITADYLQQFLHHDVRLCIVA